MRYEDMERMRDNELTVEMFDNELLNPEGVKYFTSDDKYLIEHATRFIWNSPYEDEQFTLELSRLTRPYGHSYEAPVFEEYLSLPTTTHDYHIYMIGGNSPLNFSLPLEKGKWVNLVDWVKETLFHCKVFSRKGYLYPIGKCYYLLNEDDNILIAVQIDRKENKIDLNNEELFIHFRRSQYWSGENTESRERLNTAAYVHLNRDINIEKITAVQSLPPYFKQKERKYLESTDYLYKERDNQTSQSIVYINGEVSNISTNLREKDHVSIHYDGSIAESYLFPIARLPFFASKLDTQDKYLIDLPDEDGRYSSGKIEVDDILFRDDIDIYVVKVDKAKSTCTPLFKQTYNIPEIYNNLTELDGHLTQGIIPMHIRYFNVVFTNGFYYHRINEDSIRMVTHKAISVPIDYVHGFIRQVDEALDLSQWYLYVQYRKSGLRTKMPYEKNNVLGLYTLTYTERQNILTNTGPGVESWKARHLEQSSINFLMRCFKEEITVEKVKDAYGQKMVNLALQNPLITKTKDPNGDYFLTPVGVWGAQTFYEYDEHGHLLGWFRGWGIKRYLSTHPDCEFVEVFHGHAKGSDYHQCIFDWNRWLERKDTGYKHPNDFSFYLLPLDSSILVNTHQKDNVFRVKYRAYRIDYNEKTNEVEAIFDVTEANYTRTHRTNYQETITITPEKFLELRRRIRQNPKSPNHFYLFLHSYENYTQTYRVPERQGIYQFTLADASGLPMILPRGQLDLWIKGKHLIEDIDYIVDLPTITIISKDFIALAEDNQLEVLVRYMGFPEVEETPNEKGERRVIGRHKPREVGFVLNERLSYDGQYDFHRYIAAQATVGGQTINTNEERFDRYGELRIPGLQNGRPYQINEYSMNLNISGFDFYQYQKDNKEYGKMAALLTSSAHSHEKMRAHFNEDIKQIRQPYEVFSPFLVSIINVLEANPSKYKKLDFENVLEIAEIVKPHLHLLKSDPAYLGVDKDFVVVHPSAKPVTEPKLIHHRLYRLLETIIKTYLTVPVDLTPFYTVKRTRKEP